MYIAGFVSIFVSGSMYELPNGKNTIVSVNAILQFDGTNFLLSYHDFLVD